VLFLVLLPWLIRNDQLVGGPTVGTVGGEVFWTANGPHSTGTYVELTDFDPLNELPDGYERDRLGYQLGIEYITKNPIEWITLLPKKFYHLWASDLSGFNWATSEHGRNLSQGSTNTLKVLSQTMWIALVLLILLATTHSAFRQLWFRGKGVIFPLILLYWSSVHLVLFGDGRYHVPLHPIVSIVAASAIMIGLNAWRKRSKQKNQSQLSEQL
jgi:hypothetical protein